MGAQMSWIFLCHRHVGGCACYHCKNFAKVRWQLYQGCNDFSDVKYSDDSGINAIRLRCSGGKELISAEGIEGGWTSWKLSRSNSPIFEVHIRSQPPGECNCFNFGECDDTATNGLRFEDSRGTIYEPYVNFYEHANWEGLSLHITDIWHINFMDTGPPSHARQENLSLVSEHRWSQIRVVAMIRDWTGCNSNVIDCNIPVDIYLFVLWLVIFIWR